MDVFAEPLSLLNQNSVATLSLEEAISFGIRNNRSIQTAYLQRVSQKFDLYVSEGKFFPKLNISSSYTSNAANGLKINTNTLTTTATMSLPTGAALTAYSTNLNSNGGTSTALTSLTLTQPLLRNGGIEANTASVRAARIEDKINKLNLKSIISQTVVQIIYGYRELLRAQEQKQISEAALKRSRELYEVNKVLISAGRMAEVEIIQTEADVANQEVALEEANNQIDTSRMALLNLLALEPSTAIMASALKTSAAANEQNIAQALSVAFENQPDYLASLLNIQRGNHPFC